MINIAFADFYITNVCNLNCNDCNRFNNYAFHGHFKWADYKDSYAKWAQIVDIKHIVILGGEPMLNPDFLFWVDGITTLWPNSKVEILTNGTSFSRWPELYDRLKNPNLSVRMSAHSAEVLTYAMDGINSFFKLPFTKTPAYYSEISESLTLPVTEDFWALKYKQLKLSDWPDCLTRADFILLPNDIQNECKDLFNFDDKWGLVDYSKWVNNYNAIKADSWPQCNTPDEFQSLPIEIQTECREVFNLVPPVQLPDGYKLTDANGITLTVMDSYNFYDTMLKLDGQTVTFHTGDGRIAHANCCNTSVQWQAYQFVRGKLWKCGPVAVFEEFSNQFTVKSSDEQKAIINNYEPGDPDWPIEKIEKFVENLLYEIPACSLCPNNTKPASNPTNAGFKKIKILKVTGS